jgi:protein-arginine kinase activator protein McsA
MDDFYNSLLEEMNEIVIHDKSINLTIILNEKLDALIKEEKYEEAAALRDYMLSMNIKRKID